MRIAVWRTGHEIADRVAESLTKGISSADCYDTRIEGNTFISGIDCHIAYGILRGSAEIFKSNSQWFNLDRGYFNPRHYDGYYRISYKGTQAKYDVSYPVLPNHWDLKPIRPYDSDKPILVCPPTDPVRLFFNYTGMAFQNEYSDIKYIIRKKGDQSPIPWDDISAVITFNSSVGWQAVQRGIPCLSNTTHSVVGSYYNTNSLDELIEKFNTVPREPLFNFMRAHQFTLAEIEQGKAWDLIKHYMSGSGGMNERSSPQMSQPTRSDVEVQALLQSDI